MKIAQLCFLLFFNVCLISTSYAQEELIVPVTNENEIAVEHFKAQGDFAIVWIAPEYGLKQMHRTLAQKLTEQNIEVWLANFVESLYLPQTTQSQKQLDGRNISDVIDFVHQKTGKKILVMGDSYAALSALRGAHQWQQREYSGNYFIGAILFSPYVYASIPSLGLQPEFMPVVKATNIPIMIYQSKDSGTFNQFHNLLETLQTQNNPVYSKIMLNMMSFFYKEPMPDSVKEQLNTLPQNIKKMIKVLSRHSVPKKAIAFQAIKGKPKSGIDLYLKSFKGNESPLTINLIDAYGDKYHKQNYQGQITLVNFWATWCTPCVEEIPSLNRLKSQMADFPFELISINYAEEEKTILKFMKEVKVDFPVLLDHEGAIARQWKVITYPSTFVIDKQGKIRYGVNAAIEWDDPEVISKLKSLL